MIPFNPLPASGNSFCLLNNCCKQYGSSLGLTKLQTLSGFKLFATLMVFLNFFEKVDFEKNQHGRKNHGKLPSMQRINAKRG